MNDAMRKRTEEQMMKDDARYDALARSLTNQTPTEVQMTRIESIRQVGREFGSWIIDMCPDTRERSLALTHLEVTVMWAVKAIVLEERE